MRRQRCFAASGSSKLNIWDPESFDVRAGSGTRDSAELGGSSDWPHRESGAGKRFQMIAIYIYTQHLSYLAPSQLLHPCNCNSPLNLCSRGVWSDACTKIAPKTKLFLYVCMFEDCLYRV